MVDDKQPIKFEYFLKVYFFQKLFHQFFFQMERKPDGRIAVKSKLMTLMAILVIFWFFTNNGFDILRSVALRIPSQQNIPVFSLSIFFIFRGIIMLFKQQEIEHFLNKLDKELPQDLIRQKMIGLEKVYESYLTRHKYLGYYANVGIILFLITPVVSYVIEDGARQGPIALEHQILAGYLPFAIRQNHSLYPFVWVYDVVFAICGVAVFASFDNLFYIMQAHIKMHLDYFATRLEVIDCEISHKYNNDPEFYKKISQLIRHHQKLNSFCYDFNELFKLIVLISNFVASAGICVHIYLMLGISDLIMIVRYLMPTLGLVLFTFELCLRSTQLDEAALGLNTALYNQNWYMGNLKYQKLFLIWIKYAQSSKKLTAFELVEVNMMHFSDIMRLTYKLLTFLTSR